MLSAHTIYNVENRHAFFEIFLFIKVMTKNISTGNTIAQSIPVRMGDERIFSDEPAATTAGPSVQPTSPPRASMPNIVVPLNPVYFAARLSVPGQTIATKNPQSAQPIKEIMGFGLSVVKRYEPIQPTLQNAIKYLSRHLSWKTAYKTLATPISTANIQGPRRSPTVFETPSPLSANIDAHCATASSAAPEHVIRTIKSQKSDEENSFPVPSLSPSSLSDIMGTKQNITVVTSGTSVHNTVSIRQFSVPNTAKNSDDSAITITLPQQ